MKILLLSIVIYLLVNDVNGGPVNEAPITKMVFNHRGGDLHITKVVDTTHKDCTQYAPQGYKCVPYYTCEDGEIVTDGSGLIDIKSSYSAILDPSSSKCPGFLEVCCRHPDYSTKSPVTSTPESVTEPPRTYKPQCGRRNNGGVGLRILNNKYKGSTQFGEWPHMCAVLEIVASANGEELNKYVCGASLIAPGVVLTAAHCVSIVLEGNHCPTNIPKTNIKIRCGEWDTQQEIEPTQHQDRLVHTIKIHPLFNPKNLHNDFALLFMDEDFKLAPHVDTICLPDNLTGIQSYDQTNCVATGWGKGKFGKLGEYQVIMKQVEMDMVNSTECEKRLRRTRLGEDFELDKSFVCAGGEKDKDTCKGDGGGPLVCPLAPTDVEQEPIYVQAGITAWGINCGLEGIPGVYVNVADGLCFIDWATRCQTGVSKYFKISGCENWAPPIVDRLQTDVDILQKKLQIITRAGNGTSSNLSYLHCKEVDSQSSLYTLLSEKPICINADGRTNLNEEDDIDISILGRINLF